MQRDDRESACAYARICHCLGYFGKNPKILNITDLGYESMLRRNTCGHQFRRSMMLCLGLYLLGFFFDWMLDMAQSIRFEFW